MWSHQITDIKKTEISASKLMRSDPAVLTSENPECLLKTCALQDGVDLVLWKGCLTRPMELHIVDDMHRISFSCALLGCSHSRLDDEPASGPRVLHEGSASISFNPGRRGRFLQSGRFESVTVMLHPDVFTAWAGESDVIPRQALDAGQFHGCCNGSAELRATAHALSHALHPANTYADACPRASARTLARSPLWLLGQGLAMVGLVLEANAASMHRATSISWQDHQRLLRARDRLLQDLSAAPTLPELAREAGLSLLKLKRGFRALFNSSVYGLFQQERMQEARRRLSLGAPVLSVAADLGYTNASHFTAAFHKQIGMNPSAIKRPG